MYIDCISLSVTGAKPRLQGHSGEYRGYALVSGANRERYTEGSFLLSVTGAKPRLQGHSGEYRGYDFCDIGHT